MTAALRVEISAEEIDRLLRERVEDLVDELRGDHNPALSTRIDRRYGNKGSLSVTIAGRNRGRITDFEGPAEGRSPLGFIRDELGGEWPAAYRYAKQFLRIVDRGGEFVALRKAPPPPPSGVEEDSAEKRAEKYREHVAALVPIAGTQAERYLLHRVPALDRDSIPSCYRYRAPAGPGRLGALGVVGVDGTGQEVCVQLVWLDGNGRKHRRLAESAKPTWGGGKGRPARLAARPDCLPALANSVLVAEGPETALSAWVCTGAETWVAFGVSNFGNVPSPGDRRLVILRDLAPEGAQAHRQLRTACDALVGRGVHPWIASPPGITGKPKEDFNDVHVAAGVEPVRRAILAAVPFGDGPLPPHFSEEPMRVEDATAFLRQAVGDWVGSAVDWHQGLEDAPQLGIRGAAGLGKTEAVIQALAANRWVGDLHVEVYAPDHRLTAEWAARLRAAAPHLRVQVIFGREYDDGDGPMCARSEAAVEVASTGSSVYEALCRRTTQDEEGNEVEELCHHYARCRASRYLSQFVDPTPAVRIMPHDYLVLPRSRGQPAANLVVIDERFWPKAVYTRSFGIDRLTATRSVRIKDRDISGDVADLLVLGRETQEALKSGKPLLAKLRQAGIVPKDLTRAASTEWGGRDVLPVSPAMHDAEIRKRLASFKRGEASKLHRTWKILSEEIETGREEAIGVELRRDALVPGKSGELQDRVFIHWRRPIRVAGVPVLALDADLDAAIGRLFLPHLDTVEIPVPRNAEVVQVVDTACSKQRLLGRAAPEEKERARRRRLDIQKMIEREARSGRRVLAVATKEVAQSLVDVPNLERAWFGKIRGQDCWKDCDTVFVIGREQPPLDVVEGYARSLFFDRDEPLSFVRPDATGRLSWVKERRGYRMRAGRADAEVDAHPDPDVQRVLEQIRECETTQSIDRLRLVHSARPKRVFVVSNVVLNLTVDRLVRWNELRPTRFDEAAARFGVLPLSPKELSRCFPDLWATATAAERDLSRHGKTPTKTPIDYLMGNWWGFSARYRCPGARGPMTRVLVAGPVEGARDRLEELVGPVKEFEIEAANGGDPVSGRSETVGASCDDVAHGGGQGAAPAAENPGYRVWSVISDAPKVTERPEQVGAGSTEVVERAEHSAGVVSLIRDARPANALLGAGDQLQQLYDMRSDDGE